MDHFLGLRHLGALQRSRYKCSKILQELVNVVNKQKLALRVVKRERGEEMASFSQPGLR